MSTKSAVLLQQSTGKTQEGKRGMAGKLLRNWDTSWTSRIPSGNASSILFSTFFTSDFFVAFDGRQLSKKSIKEVFEVNVKIVATWSKQWKRKNGENM